MQKIHRVEWWTVYDPSKYGPLTVLVWEHGESEDTALRHARNKALEWNRGLKNATMRQKHGVTVLVAGTTLVDVQTGKRLSLDATQPLRPAIDSGQLPLALADSRQPTLF